MTPDSLPLILLDGSIVSQGHYPTRAELARLAGVELDGPVEAPAGARHVAASAVNSSRFMDQASRIGGVPRAFAARGHVKSLKV